MENLITNRIYRQPIIESHKIIKKGQICEKGKDSFNDIFNQKINSSDVKFSAHASQRLEQRGIRLSNNDLENLNEAVAKVSDKGSKESLIIMNNVSFIVNVKNKTVVTAVDDASSKNNVFTNIDSAIRI